MNRIMKIITSALLTAAMLIPSVPVLGAQGDTKMQELSGLESLGGSWTMGEVICSSGAGDNFAISSSTADSFVFEADVEFTSHSGAASLVFLAGDNPAKGSYVANIDLTSGNARIFRFESTGGATTKGEYMLTAGQKAKNNFHLRVEVADGSMLYFLDGVPVISVSDSSTKPGQRLGLLTFNTGINYSNVRYAKFSSASPVITALSGNGIAFSGSSVIKQTAAYGTASLQYAVSAANGTLSAAVVNGSAETAAISGNTVNVSSISGSFDLLLTVSGGEISRSYLIKVSVDADPASVYNEQWRSQYHFSPLKNWLNDPNGLVYNPETGVYHLFFQYNPYGLNIANQVWGHAISTDLIHWKELDVAIEQDSLGAVFSGSAVVDENNTSGFFTDNKPGESKLVAIYTADGGDTTHGVEKQCIAYSKDDGVTWIKPTLEKNGFENPIIANDNDKYGRDFRDPKIFRYDDKWFMAVAGGRARLFTSDNLIDWTLVCDMGFDSECPDFYPLAVDGDQSNIKWVYTASGKWYVAGRLEKVSDSQYKFTAETDRITYNGGSEVYATQSYFNDGTSANRRIAISWIQDSSASALTGKEWNGAMTLPYEQTLRTVNGKLLLTSYPVAELNKLRGTKIVNLSGSVKAEQAAAELASNPGVAYDMLIKFKPAAGSNVQFDLRSDGQYGTSVIYDQASATLRVIRGRSGSASGVPAGTMEMPLYPDKDGNVTIRILMDQTVIEVFGNEGEAALCGMIFPDSGCIGSSLSVSGDVEIASFEIWRMKSIWHADAEILPAEGIYLETSSRTVAFEKTTTITAYAIDSKGNRAEKKVSWGGTDGTLVKIVSTKDTSIELQGIKEGRVTLRATADGVSGQITLTVADIHFQTNLDGWASNGDWYESSEGYAISGSNGDSFAFSDGKTDTTFIYSGVANFGGKGGCLGLVFAVTNPARPSSGTWYGANIDTHSAKPVMKLFCNTNGREVWAETYTFSKTESLWELKVEYTDDGMLTYTVNGHQVSHKVAGLASGALGLVSWNGGGSFDQVNYQSTVGGVTSPDTAPPTTIESDATTSEMKPETSDPAAGSDAQQTAVTKPATGTAAEPGDSDQKGSYILPVALGVAAVAAIGVTVSLLILKKKKSGEK